RYRWLQKLPNVTPPPASFHCDPFYTKFTSAREFAVFGQQAKDEALLRANDIIRKMFAYRHDILKALIADGVKLVVLGRDESIGELPEYGPANPRTSAGVDLLARVVDYSRDSKLLVVGEENVLGDPREPLAGDCQVIHVMATAVYRVVGTRPEDPAWDKRGRDVQQYELHVKRLDHRFDDALRGLYDAARGRGVWKGTAAAQDPERYWSYGVLA